MEASASTGKAVWFIVVAFACFRFCHVRLLWADEDYHLAAAVHILNGKIPYRDFWYDKPPLCAALYLLIDGYSGWPLRILDAGYVIIACYLAYALARKWWDGKFEGSIAALLVAFFTTFYLPSAVIPFAADALMLVPHFAAVYFAVRQRPFWAGFWSAIALLINTKAIFVLAICAILLIGQLPLLALGFALPLSAGVVAALLSGAWAGYWEQVWRWGFIYAEGSPVLDPIATGVTRILHWIGFHGALALGAIYGLAHISRNQRHKLLAWIVLSFIAVCLGTRFAPHYFLQLLPPLVIAASRGIVLALERYHTRAAAVLAALLLVPFIRFGPRYVRLAFDNFAHRDPDWSDVVMDLDSQRAAAQLRSLAAPGDSLFVWGYRPDLYVYTRMSSDSLFWDSQPLTGVPADRHLRTTAPIYGGPAAANRSELIRSHPTWIIDGLSLLNPKLAPGGYPELRPWLAQYKLIGRTKLCLIYRRM
ncbi:MAG: hypothetical protein JOY62_08090 [Acidobacteriaceae bacterium]|nr:hypothetical protein [Acidobacteriaceae bacterium]MBV9779920.1 hypothetical protein [Acidobacteriaceae bacterium]